jgi:hypothetical protein
MSDVKTKMSPSAAVIYLLETTLHCQEHAERRGLVKDSASVPAGLHRSKELLDVSSFAPMNPELFGMVYLDDVDEPGGIVSLSLRGEDSAVLYRWQVPLSFYLVEHPSSPGETAWRKLDSRIELMMDAVRETMRRNEAMKRRRAI